MEKLSEAQFGVGSRDEFAAILEAFASPFPSLDGLDADDIEGAFSGDNAAWERIAATLEEASYGGKWSADVYRRGEFRGGEWKLRDMMICPYVGDGYMIIRPMEGWRALVICRYERPSRFAAGEVIRLAESGSVHLWNPLRWVEVDE